MKSIIAAGILLASAPAAIAGPYVNIENNAGSTGVEFDMSVLESHVGYEGELGENSAFYVQGGPYGPKVPGGGSNPFRTAKSNQNKRVASRVFGDKKSKGS